MVSKGLRWERAVGHSRRDLRVTACVRSAQFGDELVTTRDVSRGGMCFASPRRYLLDATVDVAVPYSPRGGNIFVRARIARVQEVAPGVVLHGVEYLHFPH